MADWGPDADPAERGRLTVRQRAVERIAVTASLGADGVHRHGTGLGRLAGRELPRADVEVAGDHVRASVDVAAEWGRTLATVAANVRRDVAEALSTQAGLTVDGVTVHVAAVIAPGDGDTTRRRLS